MATQLKKDIDTIARWAMAHMYESWVDDAWESTMPELGEGDVDQILAHIKMLLPDDVGFDRFTEAYERLERRAEGVEA